MKNDNDVVNEWILKSIEDIEMAKRAINYEPYFTSSCCFHAQQSAEKILKAILIFKGVEVNRELKTHDLRLLAIMLEKLLCLIMISIIGWMS